MAAPPRVGGRSGRPRGGALRHARAPPPRRDRELRHRRGRAGGRLGRSSQERDPGGVPRHRAPLRRADPQGGRAYARDALRRVARRALGGVPARPAPPRGDREHRRARPLPRRVDGGAAVADAFSKADGVLVGTPWPRPRALHRSVPAACVDAKAPPRAPSDRAPARGERQGAALHDARSPRRAGTTPRPRRHALEAEARATGGSRWRRSPTARGASEAGLFHARAAGRPVPRRAGRRARRNDWARARAESRWWTRWGSSNDYDEAKRAEAATQA